MWPAGGTVLRVSRAHRRMDVRRHCVPFYRVSGGHPLGCLRVHLHVDQRGSLFGCAQAAALRDSADKDAVSKSVKFLRPSND